MPDQPIAVPAGQIMITLEELYRQYGEATIQFKIAQSKVMMLEQQIQQGLNQPQQVK